MEGEIVMKKESLAGLSFAAMLGLGNAAFGQAIPGVPAAAAPAAAAAAPAAAGAAAPRNIFSMLCMTPEQKAACKEKICRSALGQLLNNMITPASTMTGGVIKPLCPPVLPSDLAKAADSSEGAAARIKADEAAAKQRRAAVRYLGTVDCRYWPEATEALVNSLRADRNECVRLEAALSLARGCCCNKATIRALTISINCSDEDGNPPEASPRVREAAAVALHHCLECYTERLKASEDGPKELPPPGEEKPVSPPDPKDKEKIKEGKKGEEERKDPKPSARLKQSDEEVTPAVYYKRVSKMEWEKVIEPARKALSRQTAQARPMGRNLTDIVTRSMAQHPVGATRMEPPQAQPMAPARQEGAPSVFPSLFRKAPAPVVAPATPPAPVSAPVPAAPPAASTPPAPVGPLTRATTEPVRDSVKLINGAVEVTPPAAPAPAVAAPAADQALPPLPGETPMPASRSLEVVPQEVPAPVEAKPAVPAPAPQVSFIPTTAAVQPREAAAPAAVVQTTYAPAVRIVPQQPAMARTAPAYSTEALLLAYHETTDIQRREWIVQQLGNLPNGGSDHRVVTLLLNVAENDPAALVKLASIESIARLRISHGRLPAVLTRLESDGDPRVRMAARDLSARR
jgi:hypothetical protein